MDASVLPMFLSFDTMGNVGFGKEFNNLAIGIEHPAIERVHDHINILGTLGHIPSLLNLASRIPGATSGYPNFFRWSGDEIEREKKVRKFISAHVIIMILMYTGFGYGQKPTGYCLVAIESLYREGYLLPRLGLLFTRIHEWL